MRYRKDLFYFLLLILFGVIFWGQALPMDKVFFLRDLSAEIMPKRHFFEHTRGLHLWCPYLFLGLPFAANSQSEAFYPFNFFYLLYGAERGLVYYIILHQMFFTLTLYLALRRIGFRAESSLAGAAGFGFGPYLISLTVLVVLLSSAAWMPLVMICLHGSLGKKWFRWSLLLGPVAALQFLAGDLEIVAMSWPLAALTIILSRKFELRTPARLAGTMLMGLFWGVVFSLPQLALTAELTPISNRGQGLDLAHSILWILKPEEFKYLLIPNFWLDFSAGIYSGLGQFSPLIFFDSFYLGLGLIPLAVAGFFGKSKVGNLIWLLLLGFGVLLMMGDSLPVYGFLHEHLPGMKFFRIPTKFFFLVDFAFVMMAINGVEFLLERKWSFNLAGAFFLMAGLLLMVLLIAYPLRVGELGNSTQNMQDYLLLRGMFKACACLGFVLGLIFLMGTLPGTAAGVLLAAVIFADFFFVHHLLNAAGKSSFYSSGERVRALKDQEKDQVEPVRIFSQYEKEYLKAKALEPRQLYFMKFRDCFEQLWGMYYDLNNLRGESSFFPMDVNRFKTALASHEWPAAEIILARSGVEYLYQPETGFEKIAGAMDRAMVFYSAKSVSSQREAVRLWAALDFPAQQTILLEGEVAEMKAPPELLISEPARIVKYENEKVVIEASARQEGWLLLLDAYYPGWKAEVDGNQVEIFRADGFFRAVKIPAGKHVVTFSYFPDIFRKSLYVSAAGLLLWILLAAISAMTFFKSRKRT